MHRRVKNYSLVICLFVFLFVVVGGGLHMNPGGALLAALTGTPLMIYAFNRKSSRECRPEHVPRQLAGNEVRYGSDKSNNSD
jgi:peptidoglycan/LPS O-acetylase OafA/YrhL